MIIIRWYGDFSHYASILLCSYLHNQMRISGLISKESYVVLAEALKSVAHPERIAILNLIYNCKEKRMTVKSIYEFLGMEQPIVSRHLGILKRSGVLEREAKGTNTFYCLCKNNKMAEQIYKCLCNK